MEPRIVNEFVDCREGIVRLTYIDGDVNGAKFFKMDDDEIEDREWTRWYRMVKLTNKEVHMS